MRASKHTHARTQIPYTHRNSNTQMDRGNNKPNVDAALYYKECPTVFIVIFLLLDILNLLLVSEVLTRLIRVYCYCDTST